MELQVLLLFLWFCCGPVQSSVIRRYYWYESKPRTWEEAQQVCRSDGRDLATVVTYADLEDINLKSFHAWFGLKKSCVWQWINEIYTPGRKKSSPSTTSEYTGFTTSTASTNSPISTLSTGSQSSPTSTNSPTSTVSTNSPTSTVSTNSPTSTASTNSPTSTVSTNSPTSTASTNSPTSSASTNSPTSTASTNSPTSTVSTNSPTSTASTNSPTSTVSKNSPTSTVSTNSPTSTVSTNSPTSTASTGSQSSPTSTNSPTSTASTNSTTSTGSQSSPTSTNSPTSSTSTNSPTSTTSTVSPTSTISTNSPNSPTSTKSLTSTVSTGTSDYPVGSNSTAGLNLMDVFFPGKPQSSEQCGKVIYGTGKAFVEDCDQKLFVFCEDTSGTYFISETMTWAEGHQLCHSQNRWYMDFTSVTDFDFQNFPVLQEQDFPVWIGLRRNGDDWSGSDGTHSEYRNWTSGVKEVEAGGLSLSGPSPSPESCVAVSSQSKTMLNKSCSKAFPFLCYKHNVVLLQEKLSWEDALDTCRNMRDAYNYSTFDLLSVEESELQYALSHAQGATTRKVWVGLRFLAGFWFWSDGSPVSLPYLPSCPNLSLGCGALVLNRSSGSGPLLEPTVCSEKLNLLCYGSGPLWQNGLSLPGSL